MLTSSEIRRQFIEFFRERGHTFVPSAPVVPHDDPTLLFTNAGMNQFKDVFLGTGRRDYTRAVNSQKCIRAGGKHNDLDDVGHDTYHHTFFEMLGNWSFGDYFKKEAIRWAWELLTQVWKLPKDRLHATVFEGDAAEGLAPDDEAAQLWRSVTDIDPSHIHRGNKKDNFWEMGDTGPCGPCSEIHIDLTEDKSGKRLVNAGDPRVIEIWNLVFIQFKRAADGKLTPLPAKHVDTGMGLERVTALLQGKKSNYDTDLFTPIFAAIQRVTGAPPYTGLLESDQSRDREGADRAAVMRDVAYRVIADHIRTLTFALTDGAVPSNEGRGYVLRRILRRAVRYGRQYLDAKEPFVCELVPTVVAVMGDAFPELAKRSNHVSQLIRDEETLFIATLDRGLRFAAQALLWATIEHVYQRIPGAFFVGPLPEAEPGGAAGARAEVTESIVRRCDAARAVFDMRIPGSPPSHFTFDAISPALFERLGIPPPVLSGRDAFRLHDTYGFPIDLTRIMALERGLKVDLNAFYSLMEEARERARDSGAAAQDEQFTLASYVARNSVVISPTDDSPKYQGLSLDRATVEAILRCVEDSEWAPDTCEKLQNTGSGQRVAIFLDRTCFYAQQGGQVGDRGDIRGANGVLRVDSTQYVSQEHVAHIGSAEGHLEIGDRVELDVSAARIPTMKNHSATHLMNWALREVLGEHVQQKGSLVDPEKTRFDFSHNEPVTSDQIRRIEDLVNEGVYKSRPVYALEAPQGEALKINGLRAVFGEKYPPLVRVVSIGVPVEELLKRPDNPEWREYSVEFCGGTHVRQTGEIGFFKIVETSAVAKGVRRVTAITAEGAMNYVRTLEQQMHAAAEMLKVPPDQVAERIGKLLEEIKALRKQKETSAVGDIRQIRQQLVHNAEKMNGVALILAEVPDVPVPQLREMMDYFRAEIPSGVFVVGARGEGTCMLMASVTDDLVHRGLSAGEIVKTIAPTVGGSGGGKPTLAQAGGKEPEKIGAALDQARAWVRSKVTG
jgi:alanyl-tRNA synthetase